MPRITAIVTWATRLPPSRSTSFSRRAANTLSASRLIGRLRAKPVDESLHQVTESRQEQGGGKGHQEETTRDGDRLPVDARPVDEEPDELGSEQMQRRQTGQRDDRHQQDLDQNVLKLSIMPTVTAPAAGAPTRSKKRISSATRQRSSARRGR